MGIDIHALNFLRYAKRHKAFGRTITIGRQGLHVGEREVRETMRATPAYRHQPYCENLLVEHFGATAVDSVDVSGYEGATIVHDMNATLPGQLQHGYDTIVDAGCLEHIFNVPQALRNCSLMGRAGAQILHVLPANNFCGHGFWQFSPELFFSLYCPRNGYEGTEVFLAAVPDSSRWFQVKSPSEGQRVNIESSSPVYLLVRTVLGGATFSHEAVQQSDYLHEWEHAEPEAAAAPPGNGVLSGAKSMLKRVPLLHGLLAAAWRQFPGHHGGAATRLDRRNPHLVERPLRGFLQPGS